MKNGKYELVVAPDNYLGKKYRGKYCYEHHLIWFNFNGLMPYGYEIHHINHDHRDNRIENLQLVTSKEHRQIHGKEFHLKSLRTLICAQCLREFTRGNRQVRQAKKVHKKVYCGVKCQHDSMRGARLARGQAVNLEYVGAEPTRAAI